ncbi:MAG: type III PLP-dependent enzyme [Alphaproteobacteria bacterium]|nr:type III PLP-dependent enzyme [Alphaproteobacteria bacterium]MBF0252041.1 type III PLP-dependent enzyme [Alphaproteobacteria bacterium]
MTPKIQKFLSETACASPCLVVDVDVIERNYDTLKTEMPLAEIFYAVKANPAAPILERLVGLGSSFDAASVPEILDCLKAGAMPSAISYGNTVKKAGDIKAAHNLGVTLYAFDSEGELEKLAENAPGSRVYCRILTENSGAEWPLSRKFGCELDMAVDLMVRARDLGMEPHGISFHVGSQQVNPDQWDIAIGRTAMVFSALRERGIELKTINLGGGYPARYREDIPEFSEFARAIMASMTKHFGNDLPNIMIEPGRSIAAEAGAILSEVVLVSRKRKDADRRWVYLDIGMFGGLAETMGESIKYAIKTPHDGGPTGRVAIAGPTCDGADILYEETPYEMPLALRSGDRVFIESAGAYTTTYSAVNFNGFEPLRELYI